MLAYSGQRVGQRQRGLSCLEYFDTARARRLHDSIKAKWWPRPRDPVFAPHAPTLVKARIHAPPGIGYATRHDKGHCLRRSARVASRVLCADRSDRRNACSGRRSAA
jgi:hypothetical protein